VIVIAEDRGYRIQGDAERSAEIWAMDHDGQRGE